MLAMPLMCCTLSFLGMVVASKPHALHFSLSVLPVKICRRGLWSDCTNKSELIKQNEHF